MTGNDLDKKLLAVIAQAIEAMPNASAAKLCQWTRQHHISLIAVFQERWIDDRLTSIYQAELRRRRPMRRGRPGLGHPLQDRFRENPAITIGQALEIENEALEMERKASGFVAPDWISQLIRLNMGTYRRLVKIQADVLGMLAVHRAWIPKRRGFSKTRYTLTHVPTGMIVCSNSGKPRLKDLAERLAHLDWDFNTPTGMSREGREKAWVIYAAWHVNRAMAIPKWGRPVN